ncbi:hypothetical protein N8T08_000463 [Aspergillus melleus]|uniref:Uncharacterized protein n=1 Tax=Aspergillus melleus TaxID=138277 RepID=A0ACC3BB94_9EURO|nr:hypothetical protein N8T08_000463 [Aspergillus melleus]
MGIEPEESIVEHVLPTQEHDASAFRAYLRIFHYANWKEHTMQVVAVACALGSGVGMALVNLVFGQFIAVITNYAMGASTDEAFRSDASRLSLYLFVIGIARFALTYGYSTLFTLAAYRIMRNIRYEYVKAGLSQEASFFDAGTGTAIAMQATSNGRSIQTGISEKLGLIFQSISTFVSAFVLAFVTQWKLTLICCCIPPALLLVMGVTATLDASIETRVQQIQAQAGSFAETIVGSARTVHAFGLRSRLLEELDKYLRASQKLGNKKSLIYGVMFSSEYAIVHAGVLMSMVIASASLTSIAPFIIDLARAATSASELFKLMDRRSQIDPLSPSGEQPASITGDIEFRSVSFSYPMRPGITVLNNFSLHIPAGKVTALVGASGSGKSTIIGLLERWYDIDSGIITLDNRPIQKLNVKWLRKQAQLVQQEPVLFSGSIYDNIVTGLVGTPWENKPKSEKRRLVHEAAEVAFAHGFISALPNGYDTQVGEQGGMLSGGQKQRVAIARSIVSKPKILLLDEATSALDPHSEEVVQQALDRVSKGHTTITIAHKLATIRNADNIVVMHQGRIVEQGDHESLIRNNGAYAHLVKTQDLSVTKPSSENEPPNCMGEKYEQGLVEVTKPRAQHSATNVEQEKQSDRENFDYWNSLGLLHVLWRILSTTPELRLAFLVLLLGSFSSAATFPCQSILFSRFIEVFTFTGDEMERKGSFIALMCLVLAIGSFVIYFIIGWSSNVVSQIIDNKYRREIISNILRQDVKFFDRPENSTGALASRADSYPRSLFELMGMTIGLIMAGLVAVISCSIMALAYGWKLGLVIILAGLPPLMLSGWARIKTEAKIEDTISKHFSQSSSIVSEAVSAIRTVSSLAIEQSVLERYTAELDHATSASRFPVLLMMAPFAFTQTVEYSFMALGFWYGCRLVSFGELSMTSFLIAFLGVFFSGQQASILFGFSSSITKGISAANYILWLESLQPTVDETKENRHTGGGDFQSLDLADVQFSYPLKPHSPVLRGIDLKIEQGQFVAFVGASGCGKSTMIAMLERFYDPVTGTIKIGPTDLNAMNPWLYRSQVALVQQEPTLYPGTIRENVALGAAVPIKEVADGDIEAACRAANAWDFIASLPQGLGTPCGISGLQLSGGQRQRIAIARALIRNPRLLLLDEATSALDTQSERVVQNALNQAAAHRDRITVAVAHRLSTVRHADLIYVFDKGRIVESGTHEELLEQGRLYRRMCEAQNLDA